MNNLVFKFKKGLIVMNRSNLFGFMVIFNLYIFNL